MRDLFVNINSLQNYECVNLIVVVTSTDVLIASSDTEEGIKILQVKLSDSSGTIEAVVQRSDKADHTKFMQVGNHLVIRHAKVLVLDGYARIVLDEKSIIFKKPDLIPIESLKIDENFSEVKLHDFLSDEFLTRYIK